MGGLRFATALAIALVSLAPPLAGAKPPKSNGDDLVACEVRDQVKDLKNHWLRIKGPSYAEGEGGDAISAISVPPSLPGWIYASNGQVVQLSTDGGCHWNHLWSSGNALAQQGGQAYTPDVVAAVAASRETGLWFVTYDRTDGAVHPHVYATVDATPAPGNTTKAPISTLDVGLPPVGLPVAFAVSHTKPPIGYVLVEGAPDPATGDPRPVRHLYYTKIDHPSEQQGLPTAVTWQEIATPSELRHIDGITLSPDSSQNLWVWQGATYAQHEQLPDGTESTWRMGPEPALGPISAIDVDETARASVYSPGQGGGAVIHADHGDKVVDRRAVPVAPAAATHGSQHGVAAVSGATGTFGYDVLAGWVDVSPVKGALAPLQMGVSTKGNILLGKAGGYLYRFDLYPGSRFVAPPPPPRGTGDPNHVELPVSRLHGPKLTVSTTEVTVAPGAAQPTKVDLGVPPDPTPLDVYFLVDTTGSMQAAIDGLKKGLRKIANDLAEKTHGTTCFGVGDVDDYYETNPVGAYTRVMPITCPEDDPHYLDKTEAALNGLNSYGGGSTEAEAQTLALDQAATGAGQTTVPTVLPGQSAGWQHDNRVIVLVTDALFNQGNGYPTISQAAADLHAYGDIKVVGVQVIDNADQVAAYADLKEIADQTDTIAPKAGVDCDGDGVPEIREKQPMVCQDFWDASGGGTPLNLAPAIISLLLAVPDLGTLAVTPADTHHVVGRIDGKTSDQFNLKFESHLKFTIDLTCGAAQDGQDLLLPLVGSKRAEAVVANQVLVRCRAAVVPPPPPPHPPDPPPPPRPPQPPPPPIPVEPPPPVSNNPPANLNMNAGFSSQEEEQYQVAAVGQDLQDDDADDEAVELAMSAVHEGDPATAPLLLGAAMLTTAAAGYAFALRRRTQRSLRPARSTVRSW